MASFVVIATDLRRAPVKVAAGSYMIDVLEEACAKLKLNSELFQLKHNNKAINLTDPVSAAGLAQGAKLELVVKSKSASAVTVALRLPPSEARLGLPGNRVSAKVRSDTPLWKLLRHLEEDAANKQKGLNLTGRGVPRTSAQSPSAPATGSGQLYWEAPVLKFAGRELVSLDDFRKTLSQVGIDTGSQLIHLEFRITDMTLQEALEAVHRRLERDDADTVSAAAPPSAPATAPATQECQQNTTEAQAANACNPEDIGRTEEREQPHNTQTQQSNEPEGAQETQEPTLQRQPSSVPGPTSTPMDVDPAPANASSPLLPVRVWGPPRATDSGMPAAAALRWARENAASGSSAGGGGLAPTIAQMKAHQKHLEESGRNKRLKSDAELENESAEREARAAAVQKVDVRIRFPDGYAVQWTLPNGATGATLYAAVRSVLAAGAAPEGFRLAPPMSRDVIQDQAGTKHDLVRAYGMRGGVALNFLRGRGGADDPAPAPAPGRQYLKGDVMAMAQALVVPSAADEDEDEEEDAHAQKAAPAGKGTSTGGDATKKLSKFLRLAKK